jgi:hypothetical protein
MKLIIETTYDNISEDWLKWYIKRMKNAEVLPGSTKIADDLNVFGSAEFSSKDPSSGTIALTKYKIIT